VVIKGQAIFDLAAADWQVSANNLIRRYQMTVIANSEKMTTISKTTNVVTLINIFTVEPENQQRLIDLWVDITEDVMCKLPGFIAANFHKSLDGNLQRTTPSGVV
jgi:hypothetical protein